MTFCQPWGLRRRLHVQRLSRWRRVRSRRRQLRRAGRAGGSPAPRAEACRAGACVPALRGSRLPGAERHAKTGMCGDPAGGRHGRKLGLGEARWRRRDYYCHGRNRGGRRRAGGQRTRAEGTAGIVPTGGTVGSGGEELGTRRANRQREAVPVARSPNRSPWPRRAPCLARSRGSVFALRRRRGQRRDLGGTHEVPPVCCPFAAQSGFPPPAAVTTPKRSRTAPEAARIVLAVRRSARLERRECRPFPSMPSLPGFRLPVRSRRATLAVGLKSPCFPFY